MQPTAPSPSPAAAGGAPWNCHAHPEYDRVLAANSDHLLERLRSGTSAERLAFLNDPREVHKELYCSLAPTAHPEYAGTYRGTPGTSLEGRTAAVTLHCSEGQQSFVEPDKVATQLTKAAAFAAELFGKAASMDAEDFILDATRLFYILGMVHPFLDGNGHVQRLAFAACIYERGDMAFTPEWSIHPRPYDIEIAAAYEQPTVSRRLMQLREILRSYIVIGTRPEP